MTKIKTIISWSSGKDSAFALYKLLQSDNYEVVGLLTVVTQDYERVSMHGVREELLELQAKNLSLPLHKINIPKNCSNEAYRTRMAQTIATLEADNISHIAFGDIFLQDVRAYREEQLRQTNITPLFPLWGQDSKQLSTEIIAAGFKAVLTCVDTTKIPAEFIGHEYDHNLIRKLPENIDPCGENGEFHTFIYDGPIFKAPISIARGDVVQRSDCLFADLAPA
ncbi:MAG: diphthine--ammonia ligase [Gammaproteobacteria bacterium]|nr:diphthine--ammonia ligase [Gammaproteobacteria bacterium]